MATAASDHGSTSSPADPALSNGSISNPEPNSASKAAANAPPATSTPFLYPSVNSHPPPTPVLTAEQTTKYDSVLSTVTSWIIDPPVLVPKTSPTPLTDTEKFWLTRECLLRYLRAAKWSVSDAVTRLIATLAWRRSYILPSHDAAYFSPENATGKQVLLGYDVDQRPCLYLNPAKQNTERSEKQIQHLVFSLERLVDLMPPGQESLCLLVNYREAAKGPSSGQGRQVLQILQAHYPERLGKALVINVSRLVSIFFTIISPFIDPVTRQKLKFDQDLRQYVPPDQLLKSYGGDVEFVYDHALYWPALNELASQRRQEQWERWVKAGEKVGESEIYLRGGGKKALESGEKDDAGENQVLK